MSDLMTKQKKGSNATCLKGALDYQIWWLRFQVLARANGFDRIIKHREKYIDVVRDEAMAARMKNAKLHKEDLEDVGRSGGEEFDTPRTPRRELVLRWILMAQMPQKVCGVLATTRVDSNQMVNQSTSLL